MITALNGIHSHSVQTGQAGSVGASSNAGGVSGDKCSCVVHR